MKKQHGFFDERVDDLPLFSGTPVSARRASTPRRSLGGGDTFSVTCSACMDTGRLSADYCTCAAGQAARQDESSPQG